MSYSIVPYMIFDDDVLFCCGTDWFFVFCRYLIDQKLWHYLDPLEKTGILMRQLSMYSLLETESFDWSCTDCLTVFKNAFWSTASTISIRNRIISKKFWVRTMTFFSIWPVSIIHVARISFIFPPWWVQVETQVADNFRFDSKDSVNCSIIYWNLFKQITKRHM